VCEEKTVARGVLIVVSTLTTNATGTGDKPEEVIVGYTRPSIKFSTSSLSWKCSERAEVAGSTMLERLPGLTL
jgi:hypothetical protein